MRKLAFFLEETKLTRGLSSPQFVNELIALIGHLELELEQSRKVPEARQVRANDWYVSV